MTPWGRKLSVKDVGGYRLQVFEPRPRNMAAILEEAQKWGEREFLVCGMRRVSFAVFREAVARAAMILKQAGVRPGDRVMILAANSPEWLVVFWGLAQLRAVVALGNAWWSVEETQDAVELTTPHLAIVDRARADRIGDLPSLPIESFADLWAGSTAWIGDAPLPDVDEEEPALLIFTSGTTSRAKAATLSHRAAIACLHVLYASRDKTPSEFVGHEPQASFLACAPLFHLSGYMSHTQALLSGHRFVLLEGRSDPSRILDLIESERINMWATVPTLLGRVVNHPNASDRRLGSVSAIAAGGAVVPPELMASVRRTFPNVHFGTAATYGLTESGGSVTSISGEDYLRRPTSCGRALPACEIQILDPGADGVGEILVRTPSAMSGYWGGGSSTTLDPQGWIHTGDLGRLDEGGFLTITGRSKDIIIRGGENVSAPRVEACLARHPLVLEVAVVGLSHVDLGEEVGAIVVTREGASLDGEALRVFLTGALAYFEIPTRWWIRQEPLPTNATSKVVKSNLALQWSQA